MSTSLINATLRELEKALAPLFNSIKSPRNQAVLLEELGFPADSLLATDLVTALTSTQATYEAVRLAVQQPATSLAALKTQVSTFITLVGSLDNLATRFAQLGGGSGVAILAKELLYFLFGSYLEHYHAKLYTLLVLLEIVERPEETTPSAIVLDATGEVIRYGYSPYQVHFDRISALLSTPKDYIKSIYYPQGLPTRVESNKVADKLFPRLGNFLASLGFRATYGFRSYDYLDYGAVSNELMQHMLTVELLPQGAPRHSFGFTLALSSAQDGDLGLVISPFGTLRYQGDFIDWLVELILTASIDGLAIGPNGVQLGGNQLSFGATASVKSQPDESGNAFLFGAPQGTHLAIGEVAFQAGLQVTNGQADYGVLAKASQAKFVLRPEEAGGFLGAIIPAAGASGAFDLGLGWSKAKGFYLLGSASLKAHYTITNSMTDKLLVIRGVDVGLTAASDKLLFSTTASGRVKLGPVQAELTDIGAVATITFPDSGGNLGVANAEVGFQYPAGVGIDVDSDLVTGGGYLFLDPAHHKYAGAASLKLKLSKSDVNLNALGLLQTELPGNPDAYSLLLLITATFTPIELGLGFTLNGLGGVLGINRAADTAYLRGLVRQGQLDKLLFPANVLDNPADALATVDQAFPATEGRYLIGLMGRLGWGVPTSLLTLDVALLVELPSPVRLLILGVLQASLPSKTNELLKLRADFLGSIDFGAKKVAFDAALSESKILVYSLTGDMAFRLYQGDNPVFLLSAGGFHPSFQPPAGADLPALRRLTLALAQGNDLRLTLASYFAVTSNTVQFGAHLDFYFNLRLGLHVEGHFGLDTLFQFSPFRLLAHMEAGVAIKRGNSELLGLHLSLDVSGPGPWHIWGEASFRIWFVKISVDVDGYIGSAAPAPALPAPDVRTPLAAALASPAAWTVEAPSTAVPGGVVLRPADVAAGQLFLDPRGTLLVSQRVAPLGLKLDRYGNGAVAPTGGNYFELLSLTVSGDKPATAKTYLATDADHVGEAREFFAPDQFRNLSQAERLSLPSFQRLPNGLRLKNLSRLTAGQHPQATRRVVQYERLLRDGAATGTAGGGSLTPLAPAKPGATALGRLARGGVLGQLHQAAQPSARAAQPVGWTEPTYAVVQAADLEVYQGQDKIATQAEAEQYRLAQPAAADLLVVPTYQLALA